MFEEIYEKAKNASLKNSEIIEEERKLQEVCVNEEDRIHEEVEGAKWEIMDTMPDPSYVFSTELLDIVKKLGVTLIEYGKRVDTVNFYYENNSTIEYYSVKNNKYKFVIKNLTDCDIDDGIFAVYYVIDLQTNEEISFYLDLGCRNTSRIRLENFKTLIKSNGLKEFINKKYDYIMAIPDMLKDTGYKILNNSMEYETTRLCGHIQIDENIYVIPYISSWDEIRVVVTNYPKWGINESNGHGRIGYYVDYVSIDDIDKIIGNIEALRIHISGNYGYYENGIYYKNNDVDNYFDSFKKKDKNGNYSKAYNERIIEIERVRDWDGRGYYYPYINVNNGLELAVHYSFDINNVSSWNTDSIINKSDIVMKYDKKINSDKCILMINCYQYHHDDEIYVYPDDYDYREDGPLMVFIDRLNENLNSDFLIGKQIFEGTFTECMDVLKEYIDTLLRIFNVEV